MKSNPLVSIALATYNGEKYLKEQLNSIVNQTYKNIEIIVADDSSTDKTVEILKEFSQKYNVHFFVNETNIGLVKNFERAVLLCKGDYIAFADQDDYWLPEKIEVLLNEIDENLLIHSDALVIDANGNITSNSLSQLSEKMIDMNTVSQFLFHNCVNGCCAMIRREILNQAVPFPDGIMYHDWWLALIAMNENRIKYLPIPLIKYRQHANYTGSAQLQSITTSVQRYFKRSIDDNTKFLAWYSALRTHTNISFQDKEYQIIDDLIYYYKSYFSSVIRCKAFFIYLKYFRFLFPNFSMLSRILRLTTSLISYKHIQLINKMFLIVFVL